MTAREAPLLSVLKRVMPRRIAPTSRAIPTIPLAVIITAAKTVPLAVDDCPGPQPLLG